MSANRTRLPAEFAADSGFDVWPAFHRVTLEREFAELKAASLASELDEAASLGLHRRLNVAANDAASLAWNSGYPLLLFPVLFSELARRERAREQRQATIRARSEWVLQASAV